MNAIKDLLLWCVVINYSVLILWFLAFNCAHHWMYTLHRRWFNLSGETFDLVHYSAMAAYKVGILLLNLVPLIALHLVS